MESPVPDRLCGRRGQGSTIGVILVFAMVIGGSVLVVALGAGAINDTEETLSVQRAEKALTQFDSRAALVALGDTDVQAVDFGEVGADQFEVQNGSGWLMVTVENHTSGEVKPLFNQSLGAITYDGGTDSVAYQGGGVWKTTSNESVMVSPPEFHFRNGTLTLPVVNVSGTSTLDGRASIKHTETITQFPNRSLSSHAQANPLTNHRIKVTVKSEYYKGWGEYFETRTDGEVEYDHDRNIANLTLVSPIGLKTVSDAVSASGTNGITLTGGGDDPCTGGAGGNRRYTDSYNSSQGDYCSTRGSKNGNFTYAGAVTLGGSSVIKGSLRSGDTIEISGSGEIEGDAYHANGCIGCSGQVTGSIETTAPVESETPVDWTIEARLDEIEENNDNDDAARIDDSTDRLDYQSGQATLESGQYYLERIAPSNGEDIVFDTTGGTITVTVDEYVDLGSNGDDNEIEIVGENPVLVYVNGTSQVPGRDDMLYMSQNDVVDVPNRNASRLRLYGKRDFNATLKSSGNNRAEFVGVIYAPVGDSGPGRITLNQGNIWGGLLTGEIVVENGASAHYDESLVDRQVISPGSKVVKITYLHISVNRIYVD